MIPKTDLRLQYKKIRSSLPPLRRQAAASSLFSFFQKELEGKKVLSFASFGSEIDTSSLNRWLAEKNSLFLPRVEKTEIEIYNVADPKLDLLLSPFGILEPCPKRCQATAFESIDIVLVPALAFDPLFHRLGYGKGHYDRLLEKLSCPSIGVGFQEQQIGSLPSDPWDIPLKTVFYF